jgi:DNA invertase Pin-like site-specific DNA recombinase
LPDPLDLLKLARAYLELQRQLWPHLASAGVLPPVDDAVITAMVADFRGRHTTGAISAAGGFDPRALARRLAAAYLRYSCDNSNPRSLDDQLGNVLRKARALDLFVPWQLVFADASLSGTDPSRQGYGALKAVVAGVPGAAAIVIDEFSRAGRDTLEWFRLSLFARRQGKNVVGASDGFDLDSPTGDMMLHVFAMFSRFFVTQLKEKVRRGMRGAAGRRTSTGRPALGYGLVPAADAHGRPVVGADGRAVRRKAVHPPTMAHVDLAVRMLLDEHASPEDIARAFNGRAVDGSRGWTGKSIRRLLRNPVYFGFDVYNRTRNEWDPESGKRRTVINPRPEWVVREDLALRVWDERTYRRVRRRLYEPRRASAFRGRARRSRNEVRPTRLLSGTLACQCGKELKEARGGRNAAYCCFDGLQGLHGCTTGTVKAAAILEEAVLDWVDQEVLSGDAVERIVTLANAELARQAAQPPPDAGPLAADVARLEREQGNLIALIRYGGGGGADTSLAATPGDGLDAVRTEVKAVGRDLAAARLALREARAAATERAADVAPLSVNDVRRHLRDLRGLLAAEPATAGLALRELTGTITVSSEPYGPGGRYGGRKGGRWVLAFTPRPLSAAAARAAEVGAPGAARLADAVGRAAGGGRGQVEPAVVRLVVDRRRAYHERLAPRVQPYVGRTNPDTGRPYTRREVAKALGEKVDVVYLAWRYASTGRARAPRPGRPTRARGTRPSAAAADAPG